MNTKKPKNLIIIKQGDPLYHYARVISNSRLGYIPDSIAYCQTTEDVQYCVNHCRENDIAFRIRSGGHQHEGMCSGNGVFIIDLSKMDVIEYIDDELAWIPVGKQLGKVYEELEERGQIIPGGGCQSVNVGGLTQGGGWGLSIRKFGMTCDSVLECEMILANGTLVKVSDENHPDLFWAIKGGGGGNFGVVTRFKFRVSSLAPRTTSFALLWKSPKEVKSVMKIWTSLHITSFKLDPNLSTACGMMVANPAEEVLPNGQKSLVNARMGGLFYGSKKDLLDLLKNHFGDLIPEEDGFVEIQEKEYHSSLQKAKILTKNINVVPLHSVQSRIADFLNPTTVDQGSIQNTHRDCNDREYKVLPGAPASSCDRPHPHKVSSGFPKVNTIKQHHELIDKIYDFLANTCFYSDVNRYMSFHCLGGAVPKNADSNAFAFYDKPYMLQIQSWWDDSGNVFTNENRNTTYVKWVEDFRKNIGSHIEGAFINFVDYSLVPYPETPEGRLQLLTIYYGEKNTQKLREVKSKYDQNEVFKFRMSIPTL